MNDDPRPEDSPIRAQERNVRIAVALLIIATVNVPLWILYGRYANVLTVMEWVTYAFVGLIATPFFAWVLASAFRMAEETERAVIYFLGRYLDKKLLPGVRGPGVFFIFPFFETVKQIVDVRDRATPWQAAETQTKDQLAVDSQGVTFWRIDPEQPDLSVTEVQDLRGGVRLSSDLAAKDALGHVSLDDAISDRTAIADAMKNSMSELVDRWGVEIIRVAVSDVVLPPDLQKVVSSTAQAKYDAAGRLESAQKEEQIAEANLRAAKIYEQNPRAWQIRQVNAFLEVFREGRTSTIVMPTEMAGVLGNIMGAGAALHETPGASAEGSG
ncbi:MAG: hypothetical protein A2785_01845 [Candidatus Chisholmbacteria bacterium RIFCSPHIGHO2_01_FULL_49_18]|uniref:Band 7 domain-containing protein n=2 Tax=Candidatus Chisholmiibacteriota TaxID=1817900 RepID=A0A1G1VMQ7_9BACT|nr:MAG: hypothetical protein A2785_01845 [Candidatus Chisholmbacteria bacterium RIFCSPHIGHO2_01_FULL_49_18]OGY21338.1 MAG: hypothetical protein A3A65_05230 [Candidatus Chisholmbacteria bacterium RIFCSPLOWO2_01_FULL_49_14]